jgi:5S rRNA maturation endonuclease (ribonuclease M5)
MLFPRPEDHPVDAELWIVEGEGDAVSGSELGLAAVGIPGVAAAEKRQLAEWVGRFRGRRVVVLMDCDKPGRAAATKIASALVPIAAEVRKVDLDEQRNDGYDLTDWLKEADGDVSSARDALLTLRAAAPVVGTAPACEPESNTLELSPVVAPATSWDPLDLTDVVAGQEAVPAPDLLARTDGECLLYRGRTHTFSGEPETCKGWLLLHAAAQALNAGERVLYIDFEDSASTAVSRLRSLGVGTDAILRRFSYVLPDEPLSDKPLEALDRQLSPPPALAVIDGVTEALALQGFDLRDNGEVAQWLTLLPRRLKMAGSAVALIDHVAKDREARGRFAIGAQHKLAGVDVAYSVEVVKPFGRGQRGHVKLHVKKDRPGYVRQFAENERAADMHLASEQNGGVTITLQTPVESRKAFRPTGLMEQVSRAVEATPGITKRSLRGAVSGKKHDVKDLALEQLIAEGFVRVARDGQALHHRSERPYREADDTEDARGLSDS